jgi:transposase InsO family protein
LGQPRGTQRYRPTQREDEDALTQAIIVLASQYGRYGYRRITALLNRVGWQVSKDRVERIWRREGLKVPQRQKPRGRLWPNAPRDYQEYLEDAERQPIHLLRVFPDDEMRAEEIDQEPISNEQASLFDSR